MDKQKKQAIKQMVLAAFMCAAVVIPGMVAVNAATVKERAEQAQRMEQADREIADKIADIKAVVEEEPEVLTYWESIPLDAELQNYIVKQCDTYGIPPQIIMAMIDQESDYDIEDVGDDGNSFGLMQIQPRWHYQRMLKLDSTDLFNPYHNVTVGIDYLAEKLDKYDGDIAKALVSYNQGSYKGTVTAYAKAVMESAERIGGADAIYQ